MTTIRAVLFDFDGTLADSYGAIAASVNHVRAGHGLPPLSEEEVRRHVGRGPEHLMEHTVPAGEVGGNVVAYKEHHPSVMCEQTRLLPGVFEAVKALSRRGYRLGVCSNKPVAFTRVLLGQLGLDKFEVALGPEDVARPKPAPDMLLAALARLGVKAGETLYVGDMAVDVETARAAGVRVWAVATGSNDAATLRRAAPDRLLEGMEELPRLLEADGAGR
jgi:phosphoglycolate phosphatase